MKQDRYCQYQTSSPRTQKPKQIFPFRTSRPYEPTNQPTLTLKYLLLSFRPQTQIIFKASCQPAISSRSTALFFRTQIPPLKKQEHFGQNHIDFGNGNKRSFDEKKCWQEKSIRKIAKPPLSKQLSTEPQIQAQQLSQQYPNHVLYKIFCQNTLDLEIIFQAKNRGAHSFSAFYHIQFHQKKQSEPNPMHLSHQITIPNKIIQHNLLSFGQSDLENLSIEIHPENLLHEFDQNLQHILIFEPIENKRQDEQVSLKTIVSRNESKNVSHQASENLQHPLPILCHQKNIIVYPTNINHEKSFPLDGHDKLTNEKPDRKLRRKEDVLEELLKAQIVARQSSSIVIV